VAVKLNSQEVRGEAYVTRADVNVMGGVHIIKCRIWIVRAGDGVDRDRERYASSTPDECGGSADLVRCEVVQGSTLVVRPPATPVFQRREEAVELLDRHAAALEFGLDHALASRKMAEVAGNPSVSPPSRTSVCPVMYAAFLEARNSTASATSAGSAKRSRGM